MPSYVSHHGSASNLNGGTNATTDAWATAIYGFTNVTPSDELRFSAASGGTFDIDRTDLISPIPNGTSGNPTIITDNADGVVTFQHPGSGWLGLINFSSGSAKQYISVIATTSKNIVLDGENQDAAGALLYLSNGSTTLNNNLVFQDLEIKRCFHSAILGGRSASLTFDACHIHDNGTHSISGVPQDHGIYASGANLIIKNCHIYNNWGWGIHCYSGSGSSFGGRQFYNNWVHNNGHGPGGESGDGILISEGGGTIYNNLIFKNGGHGINLWRTASVSVYHNTIHQNSVYGINVGNGGGTAVSGTLVKNNLIMSNTSGSIQIRSNATGTDVQWNRMSSASISDSGSGTTNSNNGYNAVASVELVDPTNATLASRDYHLRVGAQSVGVTGTNEVPSVGVTTDIFGISRPKGLFPDQGAAEYNAASPDAPIFGYINPNEVVSATYTGVNVTLSDADSNTTLVRFTSAGGSALKFTTTTNLTVS